MPNILYMLWAKIAPTQQTILNKNTDQSRQYDDNISNVHKYKNRLQKQPKLEKYTAVAVIKIYSRGCYKNIQP